jgi:hypothetical protein
MHSRIALALACVLAACGGAPTATETTPPPAGGHPIHLSRTLPVGYTWGELTQFVSQQHETVSAGGSVVRDTTTNLAIELAGDYSVVALGPDGQPIRLRLAVDHMAVDTGAGPAIAQLPGAIVIERGEPGSIVGENGEAIAEDTIALLRRVVPDHARPVDDDAVFGTRQPQAVGATWPLDPQGAARGLAVLHLTVDPSNVAGGTTLVTANDEGGIDVLGLRTQIRATHIGFPGLPPGSVEQRADVEAVIEIVLPVDTRIVPLREAEESAINIQVLVPTDGGAQATVDVAIHEEAIHVRTPR